MTENTWNISIYAMLDILKIPLLIIEVACKHENASERASEAQAIANGIIHESLADSKMLHHLWTW